MLHTSPTFPFAPVTLSSMDNVTVQLHFVRLAFSIAGDVVMEDFSRHMSIENAQLLRHLANREIHRSTICLLEISCGWLF